MFVLLHIAVILCGVIMLTRTRNSAAPQWLRVIYGVSGLILISYGIVHIYYVITGVIELPLW